MVVVEAKCEAKRSTRSQHRKTRDLPHHKYVKICTIGETNFCSEEECEHLVRENTPRIAVKNCFNMDGMSKEHELVNKNGVVWC